MKNIKLVRIDFRLIHGQVVTKWKNLVSATQIIIVDDKLAKDEFLSDIYVMAAPPDVAVEVISQQAFIDNAQAGQYDDGKNNALVLFKSIQTLRNVIDNGVTFTEVQIGGLGGGVNRKSVTNGISVDRQDIDDLNAIHAKQVAIYFQVTPEEVRLTLDKAVAKVGSPL
ncbi:PTS sugar transporter [Enterobacterales bacterium CwR94]|nr:PTS sugar transporter [Enterobacterales bacterium CwR94]